MECTACATVRPETGWPVDPHIGRVLGGKYRLESRLGAGGFGTVLLATQLHGDQDLGHVVIKILHTDLAQQDSVRRRFVNEARAARQLGSPHAVKVFDLSYDEEGVPFIVMEYLEGKSLADVLEEERRLPLGRALCIGRQVAEALAECHAKEIIHRDLKPDNILLLEGHREDFAKILDFGIARVPSPTDRVTKTLMGTPLYMPPEQLKQEAIDHRVDIFALGVILFECVTGRPPIEAPSFTAYIIKNCDEAPARLGSLFPGAPEALDRLLDRMMAKAAADRPASMTEVAGMLSELEATVPAGLTAPATGEVSPPPATGPKLTTLSASTGTKELVRALRSRPPWGLIAAAGAALALALVVVVIAYWQLEGSRSTKSNPRSGKGGGHLVGADSGVPVKTTPRVTRLDAGVMSVPRQWPLVSSPVMARVRPQPRRPVERPGARPVMRPIERPAPMHRPEDDPFGRVR